MILYFSDLKTTYCHRHRYISIFIRVATQNKSWNVVSEGNKSSRKELTKGKYNILKLPFSTVALIGLQLREFPYRQWDGYSTSDDIFGQ